MEDRISRRNLIRAGAGAAASVGIGQSIIDRALAARHPTCPSPGDIEHVVILMQENRSFDHYFGTYPGVKGFGDPKARALLAQPGYNAPGFNGVLMPFHFDTTNGLGECTNDVDHEWGAQHGSWNGGAMNGWYTSRSDPAVDGPEKATGTMGYYEQADIPFYRALAGAFTICDNFFCSVIGPTDPNRLMAMSGTLDPAGAGGGPHLTTLVAGRAAKAGAYTWRTYPEQLEAKNVSWKVYTSPEGGQFQNVLPYFANFQNNPALMAKGITPTYPDDFLSDVASNRLPKVSWVLPPVAATEHPPAPIELGENAVAKTLDALTANRKLWEKTVFIQTYDENGGFFDHVRPPTAPPGTPGEYLTVNPLPATAEGINGPIGLGFRVPTIVVSPWTTGGLVCSDVFDHTSVLFFLQALFGAKVQNVSAWRRKTVGDLTAAFNFAGKPNVRRPRLPATSETDPITTSGSCAVVGNPPPYPVPPNSMPVQPKRKRKQPSGPVTC
jgi:phospholipase C